MSEEGGYTLRDAADELRARFASERRVLSFGEYLELVRAKPKAHARDAAMVLRDALNHFGTVEVDRAWGKARRYRLFDLDFGDTYEAHGDALAGHELIQEQFVRSLDAFVREGRANRLLLLHGPNGSAKSTFVACLMRGLEAYSRTEEGAQYRFSWVFPRGDQKGIGFGFGASAQDGDAGPDGEAQSYAHLPENRLAVKLRSELREHPLLLLPRWARRRLLESLGVGEGDCPEMLWDGELSHKNRQIADALLSAYRGDLTHVLAHVQVERFDISQRYRCGAITLGPAMTVDASERQISADVSLASLPASLSTLTLFEPYGPLVSANGGVIEYSDLLKRPLDAWRYLLLAIESGSVSLPLSTMPLNSVMLASGNELQLAAFREHPDYRSFQGRIVHIRMPYLLDFHQEQGIYDRQIVPHIRKTVAPHTTFVAALWAVLTRLRRASMERFADPELGRLAASLTPLEKAKLYAGEGVPDRLTGDEQRALKNGVAEVRFEKGEGEALYEGILGASAREVRMVLLAAAGGPGEAPPAAATLALTGAIAEPHTEPEPGGTITPLDVLSRLEELVAANAFPFLRQSVEHGYHDAAAFIGVAREQWLDRVEAELRDATGLVSEERYLELFARYVMHVSHAVKGEQIYSESTKSYEEPDKELLENVERMLAVSDAGVFRNHILNGIAGWAIDQGASADGGAAATAEVDWEALFPQELRTLRAAYYESHRARVATMARVMLQRIVSSPEALEAAAATADLDPDAEVRAAAATAAFLKRGYGREGARVALGELVARRYS